MSMMFRSRPNDPLRVKKITDRPTFRPPLRSMDRSVVPVLVDEDFCRAVMSISVVTLGFLVVEGLSVPIQV